MKKRFIMIVAILYLGLALTSCKDGELTLASPTKGPEKLLTADGSLNPEFFKDMEEKLEENIDTYSPEEKAYLNFLGLKIDYLKNKLKELIFHLEYPSKDKDWKRDLVSLSQDIYISLEELVLREDIPETFQDFHRDLSSHIRDLEPVIKSVENHDIFKRDRAISIKSHVKNFLYKLKSSIYSLKDRETLSPPKEDLKVIDQREEVEELIRDDLDEIQEDFDQELEEDSPYRDYEYLLMVKENILNIQANSKNLLKVFSNFKNTDSWKSDFTKVLERLSYHCQSFIDYGESIPSQYRDFHTSYLNFIDLELEGINILENLNKDYDLDRLDQGMDLLYEARLLYEDSLKILKESKEASPN